MLCLHSVFLTFQNDDIFFNIVFLRWNYKMLLLYLTLKYLFNS